jgi:GNAT superfamily N-acetyltransferase
LFHVEQLLREVVMATQPRPISQPEFHEYHQGEYLISTDSRRLDRDAIHKFLSQWPGWETEGISRATLEQALAGSLCFGMYEGERQIGFARVVTDLATFAFILDDYIEESYRGRGLGTWLMQAIQQHPELQGLRRWMLFTHDQRIYAKVGFKPLADPATYMEIFDPQMYKRGTSVPE